MEDLPQDRLIRKAGAVPPRRFSVVVIGGSAGGIAAVSTLIAGLKPSFPLPVVVLLHQHRCMSTSWHEYLRTRTGLQVVEAEDKMPLAAGTVFCAPPNYHLLLETNATLALSVDEKVCYSRPSIDLLFSSAAEVFGSGLIGVILTGANNDGAQGLAEIVASGGLAMVQSRRCAEWPIMPEAALLAVPEALELDLEEIATKLDQLVSEAEEKV